MVKLAGTAIAFLFSACLAAPAQAVLVTVDPDAHAAGTDISNAFSGVTLSTVGGNGTSAVYSTFDSSAATGDRGFGNGSTGSAPGIAWFEGQSFDPAPFDGPVLRVDFSHLTSFVSILITNQDSFDGGILRAFDETGAALGIDSASVTGAFGAFPGPVTLSFATVSPLISYITVAGQSAQDSVRLDFLQYDAIPEPAPMALLLTGIAALGCYRLRRR